MNCTPQQHHRQRCEICTTTTESENTMTTENQNVTYIQETTSKGSKKETDLAEAKDPCKQFKITLS
jgi:hypothetical protein